MIPKMDIALNDFSGGELDPDAKRLNGAAAQTGARAMSNWRILNSKKIKNRPGRRALFLETGRVEKVLMSPGNKFYIAFGQGYLRVYNAAGTRLLNATKRGDNVTNIPWTNATVANIIWAQASSANQFSIYICYGDNAPLNVPQVLTWDGVSQNSTWTLTTYAETVQANGQKRTPFYRLSTQGITLLPSNSSGTINVTFSGPVLQAGHVGTRFEFCGSQLTIASVTNSTTGTATCNQALPSGQTLTYSTSTGQISAGDVIVGSVTGAEGIVTSVGAGTLNCQMIPINGFVKYFATGENAVGSNGYIVIATQLAISPQAVANWSDEVMNNFRGFPTSVFFDQNRLGFCNFPAMPQGISWSATNFFSDLYVGAFPSEGIFELAPRKSQVLFIHSGPESSEFVFCDNGIYYIPISQSNPLKPGSVAFNQITRDGCYPVQPRSAGKAIVYLSSGGLRVSAIISLGAYTRPYEIADLTENHGHLFNSPVAIAIPPSDGTFSERYAYVLNGDGTAAVGKYTIDEQNQFQGSSGWLPWSGSGSISWISALEADVIFTTSYAPHGIAAVSVAEVLDDTIYLDGAMLVNAIPAPLTPPGGKGPFWWMAGGSVDLMDQSYRPMGTYLIDANGFIVPQFNGGEDLTAATLIGGQTWAAIYEPFLPHSPPGQDVQQRMRRRRISKVLVSAQQSTGFTFDTRRVPAYNVDDDATKPPPLREGSWQFRPRGRSYDPRKQLTKDTPGPLIITEVGIEATV